LSLLFLSPCIKS
jgi:glycine hydroxymethyltransferase